MSNTHPMFLMMTVLFGSLAAAAAMSLSIYSYVRSRKATDQEQKASRRTHAQVFGVIMVICAGIAVWTYNKIPTDMKVIGVSIMGGDNDADDDDEFAPPAMPAVTSSRGIVFASQEEAERWCSANNGGTSFDSVIAESYESPAADESTPAAPSTPPAVTVYATEDWPEACPGAKIRAPGKGADNCFILDCDGGKAFHLARADGQWTPCPADSQP